MYLVKSHKNYYKIVKSIRRDGQIKKLSIKYISLLSPQQCNHLKHLLKNTKESELDSLINEVKNSERESAIFAEKVEPVQIRDTVHKKVRDKKLLKKLYLFLLFLF